METRGTMKEYIRVLTRVRPPINNNDDINQVQPGSGEEGSTPNRLSTTVVDDQVVKLAPVKIEKLRFGLSRALQTYGDANEKLDKVFKFDRVFAEQASQDDVFDLVQDTIDQVMDGYTTTLISYGPTFGGKSFTMVGTEKDPGVIPRAIEKIFKLLSERKANNADKKDVVIEVEVSYVELHNKTFRNLLKSEAPPSTPAAKANSVAASSTAMPNLPALDVSETDEVLNPFTVRDENRIDIHETPALGVFLVGSGLRVPVSTAEDTFNLLRKGESNRLSRAAISTDGSTR